MAKTRKQYPYLVCNICGLKASGGRQFMLSTWHIGICEVCGKTTSVTEYRDFFYGNGKTLKELKKLI